MPRTTASPAPRWTPKARAALPVHPPLLLDVKAAGEYLNIGERFVRRLIAERRIAFTKVGRLVRLDTADLDAFLAAGRVEPVRKTA